MPERTSLHAELSSLAYTFALRVVGLAVDSSINEINAAVAEPAAGASSQPAASPRNSVTATVAIPMASTVTIPKPRPNGVHASDYVEALIALVHDAPWATRSRELRAMLGVRKDPFLRIVDLALATGRIVRTGYKATITYLPAKNGKPLKVAASRMAAGARPKSKQPFVYVTKPEPEHDSTPPPESALWSSSLAGLGKTDA